MNRLNELTIFNGGEYHLCEPIFLKRQKHHIARDCMFVSVISRKKEIAL